MNRFFWGVLYIVFLSACNNKPPQTIGELFPETFSLNQRKECLISEDSLGRVEGIACDEENLVVLIHVPINVLHCSINSRVDRLVVLEI